MELHELRGFVANDLDGALNEVYAVSRGTRAKQYLYSLSLNPPPSEKVSTTTFDDAINRAEVALGLQGQSRAVVFHEKNGRRHAHAVWSRIDRVSMKAIQMSFTKRKLMGLSRDLYIENNWKMPKGMMNSQHRDPRNFTLAQWQQAKRQGKDPQVIKADLQDCWNVSGTQSAYIGALTKKGYILARGDRNGFLAVDFKGEAFSVPRWTGIKAKEVRAKLTTPESLDGLEEARNKIAQQMRAMLINANRQNKLEIDGKLANFELIKSKIQETHRMEREALHEFQRLRFKKEVMKQQRRVRKGFAGLIDEITGRRTLQKRAAEHAALKSIERDRNERDALAIDQLDERRKLETHVRQISSTKRKDQKATLEDLRQYRSITNSNQEKFIHKPHELRPG